MKDFVAKSFGEYFKSTKEKLYSKLCEEHNIRKGAESPFIYLTTSNKVEKYAKMIQSNSSNNCILLYNTEISNLFDPIKLRELLNWLSKLKKFKVLILVLEYKKRSDHKIFHLNAKPIASDSGIDETFKSMHQSIITKTKYCTGENWIIETIWCSRINYAIFLGGQVGL